MSVLTKPALQGARGLHRYNPIPTDCVLYLPLWHPNLSGPVFTSADGNHTCTVTGADYGATGRTFDASDENINCGSITCIDNIFDGGGTVAAWINATHDGENDVGIIVDKVNHLFWVSNEGSGVELNFKVVTGGTDGQWGTDARDVTIGTTTFVAVTYNADATANNPIIYINITARSVGAGLTEDGNPDAARTTDAASNFLIGDNAASGACFDGVISEVWGFKRILPATELAHLYNVTKWRYNPFGGNGGGGGSATEEQTEHDGAYALYEGFRTRYAQRLTIPNREVTKLAFILNKGGSPTGDVTLEIRKRVNDRVIVSKVWGDASDLPTEGIWEEVTFDTPETINMEVRVCVRYEGGDSSNYVQCAVQTSDVKADEMLAWYTDSWTDYGNNDFTYRYTYSLT